MAYGEMTPESRAELEAWLAADTRHRGAYVRAQAWLRATEDAALEAHAASQPVFAGRAAHPCDNDNDHANGENAPAPIWNGLRRWSGRALAASAALAACTAILMAAGVPLFGPATRTDLAGAPQVIRLKDGSIATLGKDAKIEIALSPDYRRITLLSGEATFKVAKDKARPFVVRSGDVYAQATGTVYSVRRIGPASGTVKVTEGSVLVWPRDERDQAVLVRAGGSVTLDPGPRAQPSPKAAATVPRLPPPELAQISLDDVPVKAAVVRFNRVNSTKIVVADPAIGDMRIIGIYRADDPQQFARAVATIAGGRVETERGRIVIQSK